MNRREAEELRKRIEEEPDCRYNGMGNHGSEDDTYVVVIFPGGATFKIESPEEFEQILEERRR